jgi:serine/threonine-protein kinase
MDQLALPLARQVDRLCDRFERAWRAGERPRIEDYLAEGPAGTQEALLWELVRLDLWYRQGAGEEPAPEEYQRRFPGALDRSGWPGPCGPRR